MTQFLELTRSNGEKLTINSSRIISFQQAGDKTCLLLDSGAAAPASYTIEESYDQLIAILSVQCTTPRPVSLPSEPELDQTVYVDLKHKE